MAVKKCSLKHTAYDPEGDDFHCPKCGEVADAGRFYVESPEVVPAVDCEELHEADLVICETCGWSGTGKVFARLLMKEKDLKPCPCCKGKGVVGSRRYQDLQSIATPKRKGVEKDDTGSGR